MDVLVLLKFFVQCGMVLEREQVKKVIQAGLLLTWVGMTFEDHADSNV